MSRDSRGAMQVKGTRVATLQACCPSSASTTIAKSRRSVDFAGMTGQELLIQKDLTRASFLFLIRKSPNRLISMVEEQSAWILEAWNF